MARLRIPELALMLAVSWTASCGGEPRATGGADVSQSKFRTVDGVTVPDLTGVAEGYSVKTAPAGYSDFTVNVSAERLAYVFRELSSQVAGLGYFLLETGTPRDIEETLRHKPSDPFHRDVFYLDGITVERAHAILAANERNLIHDGGVNFGFGSHKSRDEVFVGTYKIVRIYTDAPEKYREALKRLGFPKRETLKTVWDNLGPNTPGKRTILEDARPTRWEMIDALKTEGLHFAERRDD